MNQKTMRASLFPSVYPISWTQVGPAWVACLLLELSHSLIREIDYPDEPGQMWSPAFLLGDGGTM